MIQATEPISKAVERPTVGAFHNVPFHEYTRWQAVNWHKLKPFGISALQGHHEMTVPEESSKYMVFGGAFDAAMLEPDKFNADYVTMPLFPGNKNSNIYKNAVAEWVANNQEKIHLTFEEMGRLRAMQRAAQANPTIAALLNGKGKNQLSIRWHDKPTGEPCKGRIDRLCKVPAKVLDPNAAGDVFCMVDLKTTSFLHRFDNEIAKFGYHGQCAFYQDGLAELEPVESLPLIIAFESDPPFDCAVFNMSDAVTHGRKLYRRLMTTLRDCRAKDRWPGICPHGTIPAVLPKWAQEGDGI